jgi:hypothetical protein
MKCSGVPFTHICEWKKCSPTSISFDSSIWIFVVTMIALGSTSMIHLPLSEYTFFFKLGLQLFGATFISVVQVDFVELKPLYSVLLPLPITLLCIRLGLAVLMLDMHRDTLTSLRTCIEKQQRTYCFDTTDLGCIKMN